MGSEENIGQVDPEIDTPHIAEEYPDIDSWKDDKKAVDQGAPNSMYSRYGYEEMGKREKGFAEMVGAKDAALFNAGMAAIHTVIEAEELHPGDTVLCGDNVYGVTKDLARRLEDRSGIKVIFTDTTDKEKLAEEVRKRKPSLIIAETVANSPKMGVTNPEDLVEIVDKTREDYAQNYNLDASVDKFIRLKPELKNIDPELRKEIKDSVGEFFDGKNPFVFRKVLRDLRAHVNSTGREFNLNDFKDFLRKAKDNIHEKLSVVVDNTLPSPVNMNPLESFGDRKDFVVVESATKHYQEGKNEITAGLAYSNDGDKMQEIKNVRIIDGTYLQPSDERKLPADIFEKMPSLLKIHAEHALTLAELLNNFSHLGIKVHHPNLSNHPQYEMASEIAPGGLVTLFYVEFPDGINGDDFIEKLKKEAEEKVGIGSSFGHFKTWISNYSLEKNVVRIATGFESEEDFEVVKKGSTEAMRSILEERSISDVKGTIESS